MVALRQPHGRAFAEASVIIHLAGKAGERRALTPDGDRWLIPSDRYRLAIHEASHAAAAIHFGNFVLRASVSGDPDTLIGKAERPQAGYILHTSNSDATIPDSATFKNLVSEKPETDEEKTVRMCALLSDTCGWKDVLATVRLYAACARAIVDAHWPAIVAMAQALLDQPVMGRADIERFFPPKHVDDGAMIGAVVGDASTRDPLWFMRAVPATSSSAST